MAALGPIDRQALEAINPTSLVDDWTTDFFDDVVKQVRRFVMGDDARGYALAHPRLRQYMQGKIKIAQYRTKLLVYCTRWPEHHSQYALRYYARHLHDIQALDKLHQLLSDFSFLQAKIEALGAELLIADYDLPTIRSGADSHAPLRLIQRALRASEHIISRRPHELRGQFPF